ncbi:MAG: hypothetical protein H7831_08520 [Magnetococcus sp. WYHC-3]
MIANDPSGVLRILDVTVGGVRTAADPFADMEDPRRYLPESPAAWRRWVTENPHARDTDLALILALDGVRVVGRLGLFPGQLALAGHPPGRVLWMDGFFLDPAYLASGAGGMILLRALRARLPLIANGGPAEGTRKLYRSTGFLELGPYRRRLLPLNPTALLDWKLPVLTPLLAPLLRPLWRLGLWGWRHAPGGGSSGLLIREVPRFETETSPLFTGLPGHCFPRDAATLNWVLDCRPALAYHLLRDGESAGYLLLRVVDVPGGGPHALPALRVGRVLELFLPGASPGELISLLRFACGVFQDLGADMLECQAYDALDAACRRLGMPALGGNRVFFHPGRGVQLDAARPWHLTHGIGDVLLNG